MHDPELPTPGMVKTIHLLRPWAWKPEARNEANDDPKIPAEADATNVGEEETTETDCSRLVYAISGAHATIHHGRPPKLTTPS